MLILEMPKQPIEYRLYARRPASERDYASLIDENVVITEKGEPKIIYMDLHDYEFEYSPDEIVAGLNTLKFSNTGYRTSGVKGQRQIFGFMPRRALRRDACSVAAMAEKNPHVHQMLTKFGTFVSLRYLALNPEIAAIHQQTTLEKIKPEWRMNEIFSSGIVNKDNVIPYHLDAGNIKNVWSVMVVFKKDVTGGYLSVPEYNVGFALRDYTLFMFDGQSLVHGVTPIMKMSRQAYRYSVVYYTLQNLWNCLPITEELERIQAKRTERERKRAEQTKAQLNEQSATKTD